MYDNIYHYSNFKLNEIIPASMRGIKSAEVKYDKEDLDKVSFFLRPIKVKYIREFIKKEFINWSNMKPIYLHTCSIIENISYWKDNNIQLTSTPYQIRYDNTNFKLFFRKNGIDYDRLKSDDEYRRVNKEKFFKLLEQYKEEREKILYKYHNIKADEYSDSPIIKEYIESYDKWIEYSLKHGMKTQYASYITHIHTIVTDPIKVKNVIEIKI